jgi:hypothetical protein
MVVNIQLHRSIRLWLWVTKHGVVYIQVSTPLLAMPCTLRRLPQSKEGTQKRMMISTASCHSIPLFLIMLLLYIACLFVCHAFLLVTILGGPHVNSQGIQSSTGQTRIK